MCGTVISYGNNHVTFAVVSVYDSSRHRDVQSARHLELAMKTQRILLLLCVGAIGLGAPGASAAMRGSPMMGRPAMGRTAMMRATRHFAPRNAMMGRHPFFNNRVDHFHHFHHFNNETFVFEDTLGFPFFFSYPFYSYPYYGYYPYGYYGYGASGDGAYGYGNTSIVVEVQRGLARAGYYHGRIDGIVGPQTRQAIRAYEHDHNMGAYGVIDRLLFPTLGFA
jgi:hypothetical protein